MAIGHKLNKKKGMTAIKCVALPISQVVDVDIQSHKLSLRPDFTIDKFLSDNNLLSNENPDQALLDMSTLTEFTKNLAEKAVQNAESTGPAFEEFLEQILHILALRDKMDAMFEPE